MFKVTKSEKYVRMVLYFEICTDYNARLNPERPHPYPVRTVLRMYMPIRASCLTSRLEQDHQLKLTTMTTII